MVHTIITGGMDAHRQKRLLQLFGPDHCLTFFFVFFVLINMGSSYPYANSIFHRKLNSKACFTLFLALIPYSLGTFCYCLSPGPPHLLPFWSTQNHQNQQSRIESNSKQTHKKWQKAFSQMINSLAKMV
jgi:hypothetical protein